jgi:electron transfer flavoprotein alpha subunit
MVLVFLEQSEGRIKKSSLEAATFASDLASEIGKKVVGIIAKGSNNLQDLGLYGLDEVYEFQSTDYLDSKQWTQILSQAYSKFNAEYLVLSNNSLGKSLCGSLCVGLNVGLISNVIQLKSENGKPIFKKSVFSGKAFAWYGFTTNKGIVSVMPHGYGLNANKNKQLSVSSFEVSVGEARVKLRERNLIKGKTPLTESDIVVSAGRGLKDPSNWPMIEELADILNAATACSRPVADAGWRPHHEHVGQTGIAIRPNVYIAIGISGAIQHLAGVNNSKNIIVINKDPEAPFFKAADYGICGDLFEIIPKLNEALKKAK